MSMDNIQCAMIIQNNILFESHSRGDGNGLIFGRHPSHTIAEFCILQVKELYLTNW